MFFEDITLVKIKYVKCNGHRSTVLLLKMAELDTLLKLHYCYFTKFCLDLAD